MGLLLAAVVLVLCGAAFAVQTGAVDTATPVPEQSPLDPVPKEDTGEQLVVLFGDSLAELAAPELRAAFAADPDRRLSVHYYGGTELDTETWLDLYPHVRDGTVVLLFLGINDLFQGTPDEATADAAAAIDTLTEAGASRVVMTTVNSYSTPAYLGADWPDKVRRYNDWLLVADADAQRFPTLDVQRWDQVSQGHGEWLQSDGVHLTSSGATAYAEHMHGAAADADTGS